MSRLALALALTTFAAPAVADRSPLKAPKPRPAIEVVFVLDTTGSMSNLIESAKAKVWAIANTLASAKPEPDLRIGLIAYRDRGDKYVTQIHLLSDDLDGTFRKLTDFKADGGNDTPESVNQALHEAVTRIKWSNRKDVYRTIFLVGDAPPHMDYKDDVKYPKSCALAAKKGIVVNTIQCGTMTTTTPIWVEIANRAKGKYFQVKQGGDAVLVKTPFDQKLGDLAAKIDKTRIYYGLNNADRNKKWVADLNKNAAAFSNIEGNFAGKRIAIASRAELYCMSNPRRNLFGANELINDLNADKIKLAKIPEKHLPKELRDMKPAQRAAWCKTQCAERKKIEGQILELSKKRQAFIRAEMKKRKIVAGKSFDGALHKAIQSQSKANGFGGFLPSF